MKIRQITDIADSDLDLYARKNEAQLLHYNEPDLGLLVAESPKVIRRAMGAGCRPISFLTSVDHKSQEELEILDKCGDMQDLVCYEAPESVLKLLTGYELNRGMWSVMRRPPLPTVSEVLRDARRVAVLEDIGNPTNVGAIIRSAAALHMDAVLLCGNCADPYYRRAARVSMGTCFQIPWTYLTSKRVANQGNQGRREFNQGKRVADTGNREFDREKWESESAGMILKAHGFKTVAMALTPGSIDLQNPILKQEARLAIFLGNEGEGLRDETIQEADYTVRIPMSHDVDSLNVAAASAVAFWELRG